MYLNLKQDLLCILVHIKGKNMIQRIWPYIFAVLHFYWRFIYRTIQVYWFSSYSIGISAVLYLTLYHCYLPFHQHVNPLHFYFESNCQRNMGDPLCTFPTVSAQLGSGFGSDVRVLTRGQPYNMYLDLVLPLSRTNEQSGMFLTQIDVLSKDNVVITSASRSTLLSSQDTYIDRLRMALKLAPLLLGLMEEKEVLVIPLLNNFVDNSFVPAVRVNITIMSKDLHFYSSNLQIVAVFTGLRYYMHNYPIIFAFISFPLVVLLVTLLRILFPSIIT